VSKDMIMTRIAPGAEVNLSMTDIRHTKGSMRFFESKSKRLAVIDQKAFEINAPALHVEPNTSADVNP